MNWICLPPPSGGSDGCFSQQAVIASNSLQFHLLLLLLLMQTFNLHLPTGRRLRGWGGYIISQSADLQLTAPVTMETTGWSQLGGSVCVVVCVFTVTLAVGVSTAELLGMLCRRTPLSGTSGIDRAHHKSVHSCLSSSQSCWLHSCCRGNW